MTKTDTSTDGTLWWVTDQFPYPPRNGVTLPSYHHALAMKALQRLQLVLLVDEHVQLDEGDLQANRNIFGDIVVVRLRRRSRFQRIASELLGAEMFQHGYCMAPEAPISIAFEPTDRLVVTPASAVAKLRGTGLAQPEQFVASVALVNDCTAGEYYFRLQERAGNWRHWFKGRLDRIRSRGIGRIERRLLEPYSHAVLQTNKDLEILSGLVDARLASKARRAPNGVNEALFALQRRDGRDIVFMAELSGEYGPIAEWLIKDVWPRVPRDGYRLRIVGKGASPALKALMDGAAGVVHESFVARIESVYEHAAIVISPVFKGFGLINKTLEAMASGIAVVGGRAAFNGIEGFEDGRHGVVCPKADAATFAGALAPLMKDPQRQAQLGEAARQLVSGRFRWSESSAVIASLLQLTPPSSAEAV